MYVAGGLVVILMVSFMMGEWRQPTLKRPDKLGAPKDFARFVYRFRTLAFHAGKTGSIPVGCTKLDIYFNILYTIEIVQ